MTIERLDHVSVVVDDLAAAIAFFTALGMTLENKMPIEGPWVDRVNALENVQGDIAMMRPRMGTGGSSWRSFATRHRSRSNRRSHRRTRRASGASWHHRRAGRGTLLKRSAALLSR
jgi:catechol 2,3-dioxygenase-like lactoylglutathione lyase family enzyme